MKNSLIIYSMKNQSFREKHLFQLLEGYDSQSLPLDLWINHYFRANKSLGSKDRAFLAETTYALIRWQLLLDYLCKEKNDWTSRFQTLEEIDLKEIVKNKAIPDHIRFSFPKPLFDRLLNQYGMEATQELCFVNNYPAPTTIRINPLKTTRQELLSKWKDQYIVVPCQDSPLGIIFLKKINFFGLPEFKEGLFEVQDEGSQLLSQLMNISPGDQVLDYCAGSGGKTLAFAPQMQGKGQIYLHDIRPFALAEAKKRLKRAGIQNGQILLPESPNMKKLKKKMNWIMVDAPCSGTGTLRRNPDMKWKFSDEMMTRLTGQQRAIFEKALSFLKPEGHIVYCTCSLLREENQDQVEHFIKTYQLKLVGDYFQSIPKQGGMDGFFGAVLKPIQ